MIALIVEDEPSVMGLWRKFLQPVAHEIRECQTLSDAIELMRKIPPPDLVLLDLRLPDSMEAAATLARIPEFRAMNPKSIIMVITGALDASLPKIASEVGADAFLEKASVNGQTKLLQSIQAACADSTIEERMEIIHKLSDYMTNASTVAKSPQSE